MSITHCDVAILRPTCTSLETLLAPEARDVFLCERMNELVQRMQEMLGEAAERAKMLIRVTQIQLHNWSRRSSLLSRSQSADVCSRDLIVALDPQPVELSYLHRAVDTKPLQRGLIAFTDRDTMEDQLEIVGAKQLPIMNIEGGSVRHSRLTKIFTMHLPLNPDKELDLQQENLDVLRRAIDFPYGRAHGGKRETTLRLPSMRSSEEGFRQYLVDETDDEGQDSENN